MSAYPRPIRQLAVTGLGHDQPPCFPGTLQRRLLNTGSIIETHGRQITVRLNRRTYLPVLRQATLPETLTVPWWEGRTLRYEYA